ncbi:hypothetical protein J6590_068035 [Homalodisca vitripennis]|nr:hypothetical protein J6590_068035 [Homalodisca vitripennis]
MSQSFSGGGAAGLAGLVLSLNGSIAIKANYLVARINWNPVRCSYLNYRNNANRIIIIIGTLVLFGAPEPALVARGIFDWYFSDQVGKSTDPKCPRPSVLTSVAPRKTSLKIVRREYEQHTEWPVPGSRVKRSRHLTPVFAELSLILKQGQRPL